MSFIPKPHEIYKHFKGNLYQIVAIAEHSETGEQLVVYQALYGDFKTYARELSKFTDRVDRDKYPDVRQEFRFELQGADQQRQREETAAVRTTADEKLQPEPDVEEFHIDPMVMEFLDADSYSQKLNILAGIRHRITDDMITTMAVACDIEVEDADTQTRYESLRSSLLTMEKYECNRLK